MAGNRGLQAARLLALALSGLLAACNGLPAANKSNVNRPDGEGYAGRGELVVRIGMIEGATRFLPIPVPAAEGPKAERSVVELRYLGLDALGRAVFQRHDLDKLAGPAVATAPLGYEEFQVDPPNTRRIVVDMHLARQITIQGKIIEIVEATPSGVVFRLY